MKSWSKLKKVLVISVVGFFGLAGLGALSSPNQSQNSSTTQPTVQSAQQQTNTDQSTIEGAQSDSSTGSAAAAQEPQPSTPQNCPNGTYTNSAGNIVCSPYAAPSAPAGATAQCVDGTYSFSQTHSGTCSHHGGIAQWL